MTNSHRFLRNKDLIPQRKLDQIGIVGLGGIGSQLIPLLSIMGFRKIIGYDNDTLEEHNLSTTLYPQAFNGRYKSTAAIAIGRSYMDDTQSIDCKDELYDEDEVDNGLDFLTLIHKKRNGLDVKILKLRNPNIII